MTWLSFASLFYLEKQWLLLKLSNCKPSLYDISKKITVKYFFSLYLYFELYNIKMKILYNFSNFELFMQFFLIYAIKK